jgi:hypothetical protein
MLAACEPNLGNPPSLVTSTRVLAVRGTPPEASLGAMVQFDLLVAGPSGTVSDPPADWAFCTVHNPPANNNIVSNLCLQPDGILSIGGPAATTSGVIPMDACQLYGPNVPSPPQGQPPEAPVPPDVTGGYYQPVRVEFSGLDVDGAATFALERISCGIANASNANALQFTKTYTPNNNPALQEITAGVAGGTPVIVFSSDEMTSPLQVNRGAHVTLTASWPAGSAETFPVYDATTFTLNSVRESLRLSWFASGGAFSADVTGRSGTDMATTTSNEWIAPSSAGIVHLWAVLRDDRGGTNFGSFDLSVQ